ncbi:MAG: hypothetical protein HY706_16540 [Candidatus Hydrogenedentes bacterium]|nr:hypothetical protein [Candidatus Hydrogenedentota bacterium]
MENRFRRSLVCVVMVVSLASTVFAQERPPQPTALEFVAKAGVELVLSMVLGTQTRLDAVRLNPQEQSLELTNLRIANPKGFESPTAISAKSIRVEADPKLLFARDPEVRLIGVNGVTVNAETNLSQGSNLLKLLKNVQDSQKGAFKQSDHGQKMWRVRKGVLDGCEVNVVTDLLGAQRSQKRLGKIEMDFMGPDGRGMTADQAMGEVLGRLVKELDLLDQTSPAQPVIDLFETFKRR